LLTNKPLCGFVLEIVESFGPEKKLDRPKYEGERPDRTRSIITFKLLEALIKFLLHTEAFEMI
jgi:hypothetical protein